MPKTKTCSISQCDRIAEKRGWCSMHWKRWWRTGDPLLVRPKGAAPGPVEPRFWAKVNKTSSCWEWTATKNPGGYGMFYEGGRQRLAHRVAYELLVGPIPAGLTLDHLCRNRPCVNPSHLEPVTQRVNALRGTSFAAKNAVKTHCAKGHPYDAANTIRKKDGRDCRECQRIANRKYRAKQKAGLQLMRNATTN